MPPVLADAQLFALFLILCRIGSAFVLLPGIGEPYVFARFKLLLALIMSFVLAGPLMPGLPPMPANSLALATLIAGEVLIGLFLGAAVRMIFAALHVAGTAMAFQSGLAAAAFFDPNEATQGTITGNFLSMTGLVLLFVTDAHHLLLQALAASYVGLPAGSALPVGDVAELLTRLFADAFAIGVRIAAPLIGVALLLTLALGVLNRLMPTFQVFFVALPLQLLVTLAVVGLTFAGGLLLMFDLLESGLAALPIGR